MRSKTSFFNRTIFSMDIGQKSLPILVAFFVLFLVTVFLPGIMDERGMYIGAALRTMEWLTNPLVISFVCILTVLILFSYMYRRRDSYMLHAMPVNRRTLFITHALAGLFALVVLAWLCYLCTLFFMKTDYMDASVIIGCIASTFTQILFFYGLSLFVAMVCGNVILAFITYGVLNVLWLFINIFMSIIQYLLMWHPISSGVGRAGVDVFLNFENTSMLFPIYFFMQKSEILEYDYTPDGGLRLLERVDIGGIAWMLIPAAAFILLAYLLHQKKSIERTGEIVAFGWCKVVFRVLFTSCGACLTAAMLYIPLMNNGSVNRGSTANMIIVISLVLIGGAVSFFISEMLLRKTVHIFRGKKKIPFLQGIIPVCLVLVYVVLMGSGIMASSLVPDADDVSSIQISSNVPGEDSRTIRDRSKIEEMVAYHRTLVNDPQLLEQAKNDFNRSYYPGDPFDEQSMHYIWILFMDNDERTLANLCYTVRDQDVERVLGPAG